MCKISILAFILFAAHFAEAKVVRLDQGVGFFTHYSNTNQGALATCYAHPASVLVDEYLSRSGSSMFTFPRSSPLVNSIYFARSQQVNSCVKDEVFGPSSAEECRTVSPSVTISRMEGGSVSLASAAYLNSGTRFDYQDLEGKLGSLKLDPAGFSQSDMFGETLNESFTRCRIELLQITGSNSLRLNGAPSTNVFRLSGENLPGCHVFEVELERIGFTWVNPPTEFQGLRGIRFTNGNNSRVPNIDAVRYLTLKYKSSYSSLLALFEAFSHTDSFQVPDGDSSKGLIRRYYFKSGGHPNQSSENHSFIQEVSDPPPATLNQIVISHLDKGHPVSVCMDLNPLEQTKLISEYYHSSIVHKPKKHCVTIMGYRGSDNSVSGPLASDFLIRNSWRHNSQSRCSKVFLNHKMVECESQRGGTSAQSFNHDTGNFWLNARGMIEIMKHYGELTLIHD